ncbi:MAG TPA: helix-turn-helix domain-containing protein [Pseudonocardiaceae bacterium]
MTQQPLPPDRITTPTEFGAELTRLKEAAGLTVRQAAQACGLAPATVGGYFTGTHLPTPRLLDMEFPRLMRMLGVADEAELGAWRETVLRLRRNGRRRRVEQWVPYRGLTRFESEDARWFFGRDELVASFARRARQQRAKGALLAILGPSGSGKSSVLRAGLIPVLRDDGPVVLFTPGDDPLYALQRATSDADLAWVVVDQFEELFTNDMPVQRRDAFVEALLAIDAESRGGTRIGVVIGMRADFYAQALAQPDLARELPDGQVVVGPMDRDQLRQTITGPAGQAGIEVERGLVELLIEHSTELGRERASTLPLLSHALFATWEQADSSVLTAEDYVATGGIAHAIAQSAEEAFSELTERQQELVRRLFLHLVHVGDDTFDTARRVDPAELFDAEDRAELAESVGVFVDRRLLTADADTLQISHEALLDSWPRLRSWLDEDRAKILAQRRMAVVASTWRDSDRDAATLLRGAPLVAAELRAKESGATWTPLEREFLTASLAQQVVEERSQRRIALRLRALAGALAVLLLMVTGAATYAFAQRANAQNATQLADSRAVAEAAQAQRQLDPTVATQLSLAAYHIAPTLQSRSALLESTGSPQATRAVDGSSVVQALATGSTRQLLAVADADGTLRLWNVHDPAHPVAIGGPLENLHGQELFAAAVSPKSRLVAAAGADDAVNVWNIANPAKPVLLPRLTGPANTVFGLAFSPDGSTLAAASADGTVRLWQVAGTSLTREITVPAAPGAYVQSIAFSPDGRTLAAGTSSGTLLLWPVSPAGALGTPSTWPELGGTVLGLAFSPNSRELVTGTRGALVQFWTIVGAGQAQPDEAAHTASSSWINSVAFSPDGTQLAIATSAKSVLVWDVATQSQIAVIPHPQPVASVLWLESRAAVSGCADGILRLWSLPVPALPTGGAVNGSAFSPDGRLLVTASNLVRLWDARTGEPIGTPFGLAGVNAESVAFSPTGHALAVGFADGTVRLFDVTDRAHPAPIGDPLTGSASGAVEAVAFNGKATLLSSGGDDGTVRVWDVAALPHQRAGVVLGTFTAGAFSVAFDHDGTILAAGSIDKSVRLWHVPDTAHTSWDATLPTFGAYVYSVAFSPTGPTLAIGIANGTVQLWSTADPRRPVSDGAPLTGPSGYTYALAYSPNGELLAGADTDDNLWLWQVGDPSTATALATLTGATDSLYTVAFSPDGGTVAAGGADDHLHLWQPDVGRAAAALCRDIGQPITPEDWARYAPGLPVTAPCQP